MWEATPLLSFDWLTVAVMAVISLGMLVVTVGCLIWDYRDRQEAKQTQRQLNRSILDAKSRVHRH